jgi:hypothetical protein
MFIQVLATALILIDVSSSAQTVNTKAVRPLGGGVHDRGLGYIGNVRDDRTEGKRCLINKQSGQRVCKTPAGWRAEAARLQRQERTTSVQN